MAKTTEKKATSGVDGFTARLSLRLRDAMALRRMTARALSKATDIPYRSLQNYIRGEHAMPSHALGKVSDTLDVSADWLLSGRAANFDAEVLIDSLTVFEDVRALSGFKMTVEEAARLFIKYYEKFFLDKLPAGGRDVSDQGNDAARTNDRGGAT